MHTFPKKLTIFGDYLPQNIPIKLWTVFYQKNLMIKNTKL